MRISRQLQLRASILVNERLEGFPAELNDPRSLLRWDRSVARVEVTEPAPLAVGSTFVTVGPRCGRRPGVRSEYRVLALGSSRNRVELLHHPLFAHAVWTFEYEPKHDATRVTCSVDVTMKRRWIFLLPALRAARNSLESDLAGLKAYIEHAGDLESRSGKVTEHRMPPDDLPAYRLLTGEDDAEFCHRVGEALALGYRLYGNPVMTSVDAQVIVGQAVLWPSSGTFRPDGLD